MNFDISIYSAVLGGVIISILLPVVKAYVLTPPKVKGQTKENKWKVFWLFIRPYLATVIYSIMVSILLLAVMGDSITTWDHGLLVGFTSDSTIKRLMNGEPKAATA